ncbi:hypothetical protein MTR67_007436 [Solanum verrucosum]|uniref:Uncharacterized protein n=1 Tax=Solanum verrucosum TaxID=315347 RepID=A0AAF0Q547_SOLVR|nr:hypothetical protein MTR67_007436 [Solanum verrucosum]
MMQVTQRADIKECLRQRTFTTTVKSGEVFANFFRNIL